MLHLKRNVQEETILHLWIEYQVKWSRLINKFLKSKSEADKKNYVKQRNYCACLLRRTKKEYHENLDPKKVADNWTLWRTGKSFFSNKSIENETLFW